MGWGKSKSRRSSSSSSAASSSRSASSGGRGGRRHPPGELTEQDIARSIQQSPMRVRVALQLDAVESGAKPLRSVLSDIQQHIEAQRQDECVELLECGIDKWQHLVELQRVLATLKRPEERGEEQQLMAKTTLRHDARYDEWTLSLGFNRASEDALWRFATSLMLRLKSCGVLSKVLLSTHRLVLPLATVFAEWETMEVEKYLWEGKHTWSRLVVNVQGEQKEEIQRVFLPEVTHTGRHDLAGLRYPELVPLVEGMLQGNVDAKVPVVVILRGIPGSGKSTLGCEIKAICRHRGVAFTACSADFFFETARGYVFDVRKLGAAHSMCKGDFTKAVHGDIPRSHGQRRPHQHVVLVDNTSTQRWEYEPYEDIAKSKGCRVHIVELKCPDALTAFRMGQRNSHGVPPDKVVSMFMRWENDPRAHSFAPQFGHARLSANPLSDGDVGGLTYLGLFLDDDSQHRVLSDIPLVHSNKLADHVTLCYRPNKQYTRDAELGAPFTVRGVEVVQDERGQTLRVELDDRLPLIVRNKIPHITMSTKEGVSASYSNDLLESTSAKRTVLNPPIELSARIGAALFIQNQRVITTSPPFVVDKNASEVSTLRVNGDEKVKLSAEFAPRTSKLFILYVNESVVMSDCGVNTSTFMWRAQILHLMGSPFQASRLLCVQRSQASSAMSSAALLKILQDRLLLTSTNYFDNIVAIPHPPSFHEFEDCIDRYVTAAGFGPINQLTIVTSVEESVQWPLQEMKSVQNPALNVVWIGHQSDAMQSISPACTTLYAALDLLGVNIQEETRSTIFRGVNVLAEAWIHGVGIDGRHAVQRIDTTLPGLSSSVVELCLILPSDTSPSDVSVLETKLLSALEGARSVQRVVRSCVPGQFYFSLSSTSSSALVFCAAMTIHPMDSGGADPRVVAQLMFCERQLQASREICDVEVYSMLVSLLRAILLRRCSSVLPSECRLSSLINLVSERLVLHYIGSIGEVEASPTAEDVTSGRIIFALYDMLAYLSKLDPEEWTTAFGDPLLALQGNENARTTWREEMENVMRTCTSVVATHGCVGEDTNKANPLNPKDHLQVLVSLLTAYIPGAVDASCTRTYIEVSSRSTWSPLHSLACCDKLRHAATMVLAQDDDENIGDSANFFSCAPSLVTRRVDITASSLDLLRNVIVKLHGNHDSESALFSDFVIHRADTDEKVLADLNCLSAA